MSDHLFQTPEHAELYSKFRPAPPEELFKIIVSKSPSTDALLDVGCGTGQGTEPMAKYFKHVVGADNSSSQVAQAEARRVEKKLSNLQYRVCSANELSFDDASFDVITASQCAHWFDLDKFYPEAHRVLRKDGLLALYGYCIPIPTVGDPDGVDEAFRARITKFYKEELADYWEVDPALFENCYETLPAPKAGFELIEKNLSIIQQWPANIYVYMNYLRSWSPYVHFQKEHPDDDIMGRLVSDLRAIYQRKSEQKPDVECAFTIDTKFFLYIYKKQD